MSASTATSVQRTVIPPQGGILRPWAPGQSGNPTGARNPLIKVQRYCQQKSLPSAEALARIVEDPDSDPRTIIVAAQTILTWAFGKPPDYDPNADRPPMIVDLSKLSAQQLALVRTMIDSGAIRPAEEAAAPVVETPAEEPK